MLEYEAVSPRPLPNNPHSPVGLLGRPKAPGGSQMNRKGDENEELEQKSSRGGKRKWSPAKPLESRLKAAGRGE